MAFQPAQVLIEKSLENGAFAAHVRKAAPAADVALFDDLADTLSMLERLPAAEAKQNLVLAARAGGFVKEFPDGRGIRPSGWRYIVPAIGCPADCRYCFLQTYHPAGTPVVFDDLGRLADEVRAESRRLEGGYFYGGELCDNLMLEEVIRAVPLLTDLFTSLPKATLELRTKSASVGPLLEARGAPNIIVSWTFSPEAVVDRFEPGTAPLSERIRAAAAVQAGGFRIGIRLDPIILIPGWHSQYRDLVGALAASLDPSRVESVHLGCLRFTPALKAAVLARHGEGAPFDGEFVLGPDGKMRYPRPVRSAAYRTIAHLVGAWNRRIPVRLCMETDTVHLEGL